LRLKSQGKGLRAFIRRLHPKQENNMGYRVQRKAYERAKPTWVELTLGRKEHSTEGAAWDQARSYDQDGWLSPEYRVVDEAGKAVPRPEH
jgi:hypothetical protein